VFVALLILLAVGGFIAAAIGWKIPLLIYAGFLLLVIVPLFLFFSYGVLSERLYSDICDDNDISIRGGNSAIKNGIFGCTGSDPVSIHQQLNNILNTTSGTACEAVALQCQLPFVYCSGYNCSNTTLWQSTTDIMIEDFFFCGDSRCPPTSCTSGYCYSKNFTMEACITACQNPFQQREANLTSQLLIDVGIVFNIIDTVFLPIVDCAFVGQYGSLVKDELCHHMTNVGVVALFLMFGGVSMLLAVFWTLLAHNTRSETKRNNSDSDDDYEL